MFVVREIDGERRIFKLDVPAFSIRAFCICAISVTGCMRRPRARARRSRQRHGGSRERGPPGDDGGGGDPPPRSRHADAGRRP